MKDLVIGLLDNSARFPDPAAAHRARDLSIAWTRYKYSGVIFENANPYNILQRAAASDAGFCLIQSYGVLLAEVWRPSHEQNLDVSQALKAWMDDGGFLVSGLPVEDVVDEPGGEPCCFLVNLERYRALDCPTFGESGDKPFGWNFIQVSEGAGLPVPAMPSEFAANLVFLDPDNPAAWAPLPDAADDRDPDNQESPADQSDFLSRIHHLTAKLPQGIFVWNLESYADVEQPSEHFKPPLKSLYTVSAGFKPNRILQTHGFTAETRMVVFDYSAQGLEFRRMLREEWDGLDYPSFLRRLFRKIPHGEAHYLLWEGMTPDNLDWALVDQRWQQELDDWGGQDALHQHWQTFQQMQIEYVHCNILTENDHLIEVIRDEDNSLIWWSNAFFSIFSNWCHTGKERSELYLNWVEKLARKAPHLLLYGSDCYNISVNFFPAAEYAIWLQKSLNAGHNELNPASMNRYEMRY